MYGYAFTSSAAKDLYAFRRDARLLIRLLSEIIPGILPDPRSTGQKKRGPLDAAHAHGFTHGGVAYRLVHTVDDSRRLVTFIAFGPHDAAYARAGRRS